MGAQGAHRARTSCAPGPRRPGSDRNYLLTGGFSSADTLGVPAHQESGLEARRTTAIKSQKPHGTAAFPFAYYFHGDSTGGRKSYRFTQVVPGLPTRRAAAIFWTPGRRSFRTDRLEPSWPHRFPIAHHCASSRQHLPPSHSPSLPPRLGSARVNSPSVSGRAIG